jgi:hypothetical protein
MREGDDECRLQAMARSARSVTLAGAFFESSARIDVSVRVRLHRSLHFSKYVVFACLFVCY